MEQLFSPDFLQMLLRLLLSVGVTFLLVHFLYYPKSRRRDFYFTFMLISISIFLLVFYMMFTLEGMKMNTSMGIGIGLFGIFSIMRYRTDTIPVREMTYLFMIIALSVVNAIALEVNILRLVFADLIVLLATFVCEKGLKMHATKIVLYDRIELVKPEKRDELIRDLEERTGLDIYSVEVGGMDFLKDAAVLKIHYRTSKNEGSNSVDNMIKVRQR